MVAVLLLLLLLQLVEQGGKEGGLVSTMAVNQDPSDRRTFLMLVRHTHTPCPPACCLPACLLARWLAY